MKNEFELTDFFFLTDINVNNRMSSDELSALHDSYARDVLPDEVIKISGASEDENPVIYTYAKFLEILDTQGLSGLINA